ncbi:MAG: 1-deoxy-D-xylulose-5-phosphate reductoisomerase [Chloroflexi bacterium]|nr:1-deoxy-D-xylulose-5-phosphate reductoisomerase [Chloroflexota bacterium]MBM4434563.1 1-deoxy-D-xylulose-5-phosphate reductoisomerase [Chloroflexota bacterium]
MASELTRVAVLGSTGSIGQQALDVVRALPDRFRLVALAAGGNVGALRDQALEFRPEAVWARPGRDADALRSELPAASWQPLEAMAARADVDVVLVATSGLAGMAPTLAALTAGKAVAIANKEVLVVGGRAVRAALEGGRARGAELRPVDSEHSAIWQCLWGEEPRAVARLTLTASGGAFRDRDREALERVTPEEALRHPTWRMGPKVTVDSATLFNKGLEAIEARWLFDIPLDRIDVLQHRESVVHSMVTFVDGSVKAQLGEPDMRLPIQVALGYPARLPAQPAPAMDLAARGTLTFAPVDRARFPALAVALEAGARDDTSAAAVSGADESAVAHFLAGRCRFTDIPRLLERALEAHRPAAEPALEELLAAERWGRRFVDEAVMAGTAGVA